MIGLILVLGLYVGIYTAIEGTEMEVPRHRVEITERQVGELYCPAPTSGYADEQAIVSMESCESQDLCLSRYDNATGEYTCSPPIVWGVGSPPGFYGSER